MVYEEFKAICQTATVVVQRPDFTDADRREFLHHFSEENQHGLAGFAVMGGVFGEGIDLIGDRLSGVAIIGPGLPGIGQQRELIKEYFDHQQQGNGFRFAYQYPGINKVLQAAGRVIRAETDKGVVLLIDERFLNYSYNYLLPAAWQPVQIDSVVQMETVLQAFWRKNKYEHE
jgi:DNA excision repair protein ERCC-2